MHPRNPDWLYHADIGSGPGHPPRIMTIRGVEDAEIEGRPRTGLRFRFRRRFETRSLLLVLNAANTHWLVDRFGADRSRWVGRRVALITVETDSAYGPGIRLTEADA